MRTSALASSVNPTPLAKGSAVATENACKVCAPLGASLVFRGIRGAMPLLHGSQGCATYIRRYLISHFREPMDIASSSFAEASTIFGGSSNLATAVDNVVRQYRPEVIGIATSCLAETIGEDVPAFLHAFRRQRPEADVPAIVSVSTPSFKQCHADGFQATVAAVIEQLAEGGERLPQVNVLPGLVSPADLRHLRELCGDFGLPAVMLPDYADTLDAPTLAEYPPIPAGGTSLGEIRSMGRSAATLQLGRSLAAVRSPGARLEERFGVPLHRLGLPIGVRETDGFIGALAAVSGRPVPDGLVKERGRLLDAYVDGHKYLFGKRAVVFGDEDFAVALCSFLTEIGVVPVAVASGGTSGRLAAALREADPSLGDVEVLPDADFALVGEVSARLRPDLMLGSSKGYGVARTLGVPLLRVGFPIHDRIGAARICQCGYRGTLSLFDTLVNTLLEREQNTSPVGYSYL